MYSIETFVKCLIQAILAAPQLMLYWRLGAVTILYFHGTQSWAGQTVIYRYPNTEFQTERKALNSGSC